MDLRLKKLEDDADNAGKAPARAHVSRDRGQARDEGLRLLPRSRALDDYWRKGAIKRASGPGSKDVRYPMRARYCREPREERKIWHARLRNVSGDESGPPAGRVKDNPAHTSWRWLPTLRFGPSHNKSFAACPAAQKSPSTTSSPMKLQHSAPNFTQRCLPDAAPRNCLG